MRINLSVVVPAYNASDWLPLSIPKIEDAVSWAGIEKAEIIIVDDGSMDDTAKIAKALKAKYPIRVISQKNSGRFLARDRGVKSAKYSYILFIDTRIFIGKNSLKYLIGRLDSKKDKLVWTSHVHIDKQANIYARFWDALTFIAWRRYFSNPRDCSYGIKDFDYYPKGTTCFFAPKEVISDANDWFTKNTKNIKASNDDTLLIRHIAENHQINLSPRFYCTYHARTNLRQYQRHVRHRGKVFVDGFLRRDGNRFFWPLILFLVLSACTIPLLIIFPQYILPLILILIVGWVFELLISLVLGVPSKDALSLFVLTPLFAVQYGLGIWSAVADIYIRKEREA